MSCSRTLWHLVRRSQEQTSNLLIAERLLYLLNHYLPDSGIQTCIHTDIHLYTFHGIKCTVLILADFCNNTLCVCVKVFRNPYEVVTVLMIQTLSAMVPSIPECIAVELKGCPGEDRLDTLLELHQTAANFSRSLETAMLPHLGKHVLSCGPVCPVLYLWSVLFPFKMLSSNLLSDTFTFVRVRGENEIGWNAASWTSYFIWWLCVLACF